MAGGDAIRIGILGASGYTGADLVRLLLRHRRARIVTMTADRHAGKPISAVFPHLVDHGLPDLVRVEDADWSACGVVFCALPHGTTQEIVARLPADLKVVDLSADFRLRDPETYAAWYGHEHYAPNLQPQAVYGLTELHREAVRDARLVACPGCYPTAALLAVQPLLDEGLVDPDSVVMDAKSGVSGAGRSLKENTLFCEAGEGVSAYGVGKHRHMPEIEQELSAASGRPVLISFTPHLIPMSRGELITAYLKLGDGVTAETLNARLAARYDGEPFVRVLPMGTAVSTVHVRGSNRCLISVFPDRRPGHALVLSAIDNLVKGSSGQAIQNMNLMCGLDETEGLEQVALFP
ncbi:MAG: N-acetyl-gamma-glutamyl-phosphate reductase [Azospirillaceae bacterium]